MIGDGWAEDWLAGVIGEAISDREMGAVGRLMGKFSVRRFECRATAVGGRAGIEARLRARGLSKVGGEDMRCGVSGASLLAGSGEFSMTQLADDDSHHHGQPAGGAEEKEKEQENDETQQTSLWRTWRSILAWGRGGPRIIP